MSVNFLKLQIITLLGTFVERLFGAIVSCGAFVGIFGCHTWCEQRTFVSYFGIEICSNKLGFKPVVLVLEVADAATRFHYSLCSCDIIWWFECRFFCTFFF
jgi:hypothetical protein